LTKEDIEILKSVIKEEVYSFLSEVDSDLKAEEDEHSDKIEDEDESSEAAPKRKRVVRRGKLRFKMTCPDGWSWDKKKNICVLPPRSTQIKRSRAAKRGSRKRRAFAGRIAKSRKKSMRKLRKPFKPKRR
jgi:hypothetical protein